MRHKCLRSLTMKPIKVLFAVIWICKSVRGAPQMDGDRIVGFDDFDEYKLHMNKTYWRPYAEQRGRVAFAENMRLIREHNAAFKQGKYAFGVAANHMADLSNQQYLRAYVRLKRSYRRKLQHNDANELVGLGAIDDGSLPDSLDWREMGFITPPDNQKSCGSCYAFSIARSIEAQIFRRIDKIVELSPQQILDCSVSVGNHGCTGGSLRNTLRYAESCGGLMRAVDYPYTSSQNKCSFNSEMAVVNISSWAILPARDEHALKTTIATIGPVAVSINASPTSFQLYSHGVYDDDSCSAATVNHAMLAIGYTPDYWILKNWWGKNWGDDGYMKIKRNKNLCGISNYAAYAVV